MTSRELVGSLDVSRGGFSIDQIINYQDGVAIVEEINTYNGVGGRGGGPFAGDELFAVGGEIASHLSYTAVVDRIRSSARPIALTFR